MGVAEDEPRLGHAREQLGLVVGRLGAERAQVGDGGGVARSASRPRRPRSGSAPSSATRPAPSASRHARDRRRDDRVVGRVAGMRGPALAVAADPDRAARAPAAARPSPAARRRRARSRRRAGSARRPGRRRRRAPPRARAGCRGRRRGGRARRACIASPRCPSTLARPDAHPALRDRRRRAAAVRARQRPGGHAVVLVGPVHGRVEQPGPTSPGSPASARAASCSTSSSTRAPDGPIGVTGLSELSRRNRHATVGTWFGRRWWGSGANLESKALIAALAFEHLGLDRLTAWANTRNGRSQVALERAGFRREGVLRGWHRHGDVLHDVVVFGMLRGGLARIAAGGGAGRGPRRAPRGLQGRLTALSCGARPRRSRARRASRPPRPKRRGPAARPGCRTRPRP